MDRAILTHFHLSGQKIRQNQCDRSRYEEIEGVGQSRLEIASISTAE